MDINYRNYPIDYVQRLQGQRKREKARCFWEYYHDVQMREVNSFGFYAVSWGSKDKPKSKGTVYKWIAEFVLQIEKFYDAQSLNNMQHYRSVKKQSERQVNGKRTDEQPQTPTTPSDVKIVETASERQVNKDNNIDNNNTRAWFDNFYFIYRMSNKYAGNKQEAYEIYKTLLIQDSKLLALAGLRYCNDVGVERKVGARRFLEDEIYLSYMSTTMIIRIGEEWVSGEYDSQREVFTAEGEKEYAMDIETMIGKFGKGELEFMRGAA